MSFAQTAITETLNEKGFAGQVRGQERIVNGVAEGVQAKIDTAVQALVTAATTKYHGQVSEADVRALLTEAGLIEAPAPADTPAEGGTAAGDLATLTGAVNQLIDLANQRLGTRFARI